MVTQAELQQEVERFAASLLASLADAADRSAATDDLALRDDMLRLELRYASSAIDIATGTSPEIALLDMLVFVELCRAVLERHWIPREFGEPGRLLLDAFTRQRDALWKIADKVLTPDEESRVQTLVRDWLEQHPDRVRVEGVRFTEFATLAGRGRQEASGLFGAVKNATRTADRAVLLADRGMFLAQHMPFLIRLQTRLGASEVLGDALDRWRELETLLAKMPELDPLVQGLSTLSREATAAYTSASKAFEALETLGESLPTRTELQHMIDSLVRLADTSRAALAELNTLVPKDAQRALAGLSTLEARADRLMRRFFVYLVALGVAWALIFCGAYYVAKRLASQHGQAASVAGVR